MASCHLNQLSRSLQIFFFSSWEMSRDKSLSTSASASSYQSEIFFLTNYIFLNPHIQHSIPSIPHLMSIVLQVLGLAPSSLNLMSTSSILSLSTFSFIICSFMLVDLTLSVLSQPTLNNIDDKIDQSSSHQRPHSTTPPVYIRFDRFEDDVPRRGLWGSLVQLHLLHVLHDLLHVLIRVL